MFDTPVTTRYVVLIFVSEGTYDICVKVEIIGCRKSSKSHFFVLFTCILGQSSDRSPKKLR